MVSSTPRPHFTPGKDPIPILQEAGWAPGPVWTGGKSRPHRDSIPDRPAHNQSRYRLSYRPTICLTPQGKLGGISIYHPTYALRDAPVTHHLCHTSTAACFDTERSRRRNMQHLVYVINGVSRRPYVG